jgi:hypothetical protein
MDKPFLTQNPPPKTNTDTNPPKNPPLPNMDNKKNNPLTPSSWLHDTCDPTEGDNNQ